MMFSDKEAGPREPRKHSHLAAPNLWEAQWGFPQIARKS